MDWTDLRREAARRFRVTRFRPGQRELIEAALTGHDALGILPTGGGKSLTYQLPAVLLPRAVVVVSPLISLMEDQQRKAEAARIGVAKLDSTLSASEERETVAEIESGGSELIYLTPERLENPEHVEPLRARGVSLFVIDEAHCISQWGHDFRPAYLALPEAIRALGRPPVLALTATATPEVAQDIVRQLGIPGARVVNTGIERPNLRFEVRRTVNGEAKRQALLGILREEPGSGIVYAATVRKVEELWRWLAAQGIDAVRCPAGEAGQGGRRAARGGRRGGAARAEAAPRARARTGRAGPASLGVRGTARRRSRAARGNHAVRAVGRLPRAQAAGVLLGG